eukprot:647305-Amphidinium_carterae.1
MDCSFTKPYIGVTVLLLVWMKLMRTLFAAGACVSAQYGCRPNDHCLTCGRIDCDRKDATTLLIERIHDVGLFHDWNENNKSSKVLIGDMRACSAIALVAALVFWRLVEEIELWKSMASGRPVVAYEQQNMVAPHTLRCCQLLSLTGCLPAHRRVQKERSVELKDHEASLIMCIASCHRGHYVYSLSELVFTSAHRAGHCQSPKGADGRCLTCQRTSRLILGSSRASCTHGS